MGTLRRLLAGGGVADAKRRGWGWLAVLFGVPVVASIACCADLTCLPYGVRYGLWHGRCPAYTPQLGLQADAYGIVRGQPGTVVLRPFARILGSYGQVDEATLSRGVGVTMALEDASGNEVPGFELAGWDGWVADVRVPAVADGDYLLRVKGASGFGDAEVELPLPLYAPALTHLVTDRPLYRPGQDVLLRAVMFRRTDLSPIENRSGRWRVYSPSGDELLVERDATGVFGVADASFPLDSDAEVGVWRAVWESADVRAEAPFDVRPFQLPRLQVAATPTASWYGAGDRVIVGGQAKYASGAPVAGAAVRLTVAPVDGRWPAPLAWENELSATTDANGRFSVAVGDVPADVLERASFRASIRVTDAAGETVDGDATFVVSERPILIDAVTEFVGVDGSPSGLAANFNNRAYLRVTTPDGVAVRNQKISVQPWWDASAVPTEAVTDADGVAAIQVDPGAPVPVVVPAPPFRPRPLVPDAVALTRAEDLVGGALDLDDRRALDRVAPAIADCGDLTVGGEDVAVAVRTSRGVVLGVSTSVDSPIARCVAAVARRLSLPGDTRTLALTWRVPDSRRPWMSWRHSAAVGAAPEVALTDAGLAARACVARGRGASGADALTVHWSVAAGERAVATEVVPGRDAGLSAAEQACLAQSLARLALDAPAEGDAMGVSVATWNVPSAGGAPEADHTVQAYQLRVALGDGAARREGSLVLPPGQVPDLRIRPSPAVVAPGAKVRFDFLRGPGFVGDLPTDVTLQHGSVEVAKAPFDAPGKFVEFDVPADADGLYHVEWRAARAVVFVAPKERFSVDIRPDAAAYRPGDVAHLDVRTHRGETGVPAGVGLIGVDAMLGELAPLTGPDDYGRVTVRATSASPAFGLYGPASLLLGQITGENAALATVLRVTQVPMDAAGDAPATASAQTVNRDDERMADAFYRAYAFAVARVGDWEAAAKLEDKLTNQRMAEIWVGALSDCDAAGAPAVDGFGRRLTLDVLPEDLVRQLDPRGMATRATSLPEDVVDWTRWVQRGEDG